MTRLPDLDPDQLAALAVLIRRTLDTVPPADRPADRRMRRVLVAAAEQADPK